MEDSTFKKFIDIGDKIIVLTAGTSTIIGELEVIRVSKTMAFTSDGKKFKRQNFGYVWRIDLSLEESNEIYKLK